MESGIIYTELSKVQTEPVKIKYVLLSKYAKPFAYTRTNDACMDIYSSEEVTIYSKETKIIKTGVSIAIPEGYEGIIRGRSGMSAKGIFVEHGTIDSEYRGEIGVILYNSLVYPCYVHVGDRIAQFTIKKVIPITMEKVEVLNDTERGSQGFGSSGD